LLVVSLEWVWAVTKTASSYSSAMKLVSTVTADTFVFVCAASLQITQDLLVCYILQYRKFTIVVIFIAVVYNVKAVA